MIRLLYLSQANSGIEEEQVQAIHETSQRNNAIEGITGVLISGGGMFLQLLEGSEEAVFKKYVKILDDTRHSHCKIIYISPAKEPMFQKWSMGLIQAKRFNTQRIDQFRAMGLGSIDSKAFADIIREFVQILNGNHQ